MLHVLTFALIPLLPSYAVNRTTPELRTACRKPNTSCRRNTGRCMVDVCTAEMVENDGYVPIQLGVHRSGANCDRYTPPNPYGGYVALKCNFLLNTGFGKSRGEFSIPRRQDGRVARVLGRLGREPHLLPLLFFLRARSLFERSRPVVSPHPARTRPASARGEERRPFLRSCASSL